MMMEEIEKSREIWVTEFNEKSAQDFRDKVLEVSQKDPNQVIPIYIDSYGGEAFSLVKIIETMDEVPNQFMTICQGKAVSCGAILLSHGDIRFVGKYSTVMIHNISSGSYGCAFDIKENSDEIIRLNKVLIGLLAENCGISYKDLQNRIKETTSSKEIWLSPADSVKFGVADEVGTPVVKTIVQQQVLIATKERINRKPPKQKKPEKKSKKKK